MTDHEFRTRIPVANAAEAEAKANAAAKAYFGDMPYRITFDTTEETTLGDHHVVYLCDVCAWSEEP